MKAFEELTRHELNELSDEQISHYIDMRCAENGVALLPDPPNEPDAVDIVPDIECWIVGGEIFESKTDADAVVKCMLEQPTRRKIRYLRSYYSGPQGIEPVTEEDDISVRAARYWSTAHYDLNAKALAKHKEAKEAYEREKSMYDEIHGKRNTIAEEVYRTIREAYEETQEESRILMNFERYLALADGNRETALKFFLEAAHQYKHDLDKVREVLGADGTAEQDD